MDWPQGFKGIITLPIRHLWRLAYIDGNIGDHPHKKCNRSHRHAPCSGRDTLYAQGYAEDVCKAFSRCCREVDNQCTVSVLIPVVFECATPVLALDPAVHCIEMSPCDKSVWDSPGAPAVVPLGRAWPDTHAKTPRRWRTGSSADPLLAKAGVGKTRAILCKSRCWEVVAFSSTSEGEAHGCRGSW